MASENTQLGFSTRAIHIGQEPDPGTGATVTPIYQTSTFTWSSLGSPPHYMYSRLANPTRTAFEKCLASLEGEGASGYAFPSGMAAVAAAFSILKPGDHALIMSDLYGGTYRYCEKILTARGVKYSYFDAGDIESVEKSFQPETRMIWLESPSNPLLRVVDLAALAKVAHRHNALAVVDNTFASPYFQNPLELCIDIVIHSTTKYIGGHSDLIGGAVVTRNPELMAAIELVQTVGGSIAGPFDCWLALRGLKTLAVRMEKHASNAMAVALFLSQHPKVSRVYYPGLKSDPGHKLALRQMRGFGGMVSFEVEGGAEKAVSVSESTRIFALAESLGGIESLIGYPVRMSHATMSPGERAKRGINDNLIRLSIGLEDAEDLIVDLKRALE